MHRTCLFALILIQVSWADFSEALRSHPSVRALQARFEAANLLADNAARLPEPSIGFMQAIEPVVTKNGEMQSKLSLSQTFPPRLMRTLLREAKTLEAQQLQIRILKLIRTFQTRASLAHLQLLTLEKKQSVYREEARLLEFAESTLAAHIQHHSFGLSDVLRVRSLQARVQSQLVEIDNRREAAKAELRFLYKDLPQEGIDLPSLDSLTPQTGSFAQHPDRLLLQNQLQLSKTKAQKAGAKRRPSFTVGADYGFVDGLSEAPEQGDDTLSIRVGLQLKTRNGYYNNLQKARNSQAEASNHEIQALIREQENRIIEHKSRFLSSRNLYHQLGTTILPNLEKAFEAARQNYAAGKGNANQLIETMLELLKARREEIVQFHQAWEHWIWLNDYREQNGGIRL